MTAVITGEHAVKPEVDQARPGNCFRDYIASKTQVPYNEHPEFVGMGIYSLECPATENGNATSIPLTVKFVGTKVLDVLDALDVPTDSGEQEELVRLSEGKVAAKALTRVVGEGDTGMIVWSVQIWEGKPDAKQPVLMQQVDREPDGTFSFTYSDTIATGYSEAEAAGSIYELLEWLKGYEHLMKPADLDVYPPDGPGAG